MVQTQTSLKSLAKQPWIIGSLIDAGAMLTLYEKKGISHPKMIEAVLVADADPEATHLIT